MFPPPPAVTLNVKASSSPAYSQQLSADTLQRSGNGISQGQKVFEQALYARSHKSGSLGFLVKWEHDLRAKNKEIEALQQLLSNTQNTDKVTELFRKQIEDLIQKAKSELATIEHSKDTALFYFGRDLQRFKTQEGDIDPTHLAQHQDFEIKMAFRADGHYPENHHEATVLPAQAFWRELGQHYLDKVLKTHDVGMLERFDYPVSEDF